MENITHFSFSATAAKFKGVIMLIGLIALQVCFFKMQLKLPIPEFLAGFFASYLTDFWNAIKTPSLYGVIGASIFLVYMAFSSGRRADNNSVSDNIAIKTKRFLLNRIENFFAVVTVYVFTIGVVVTIIALATGNYAGFGGEGGIVYTEIVVIAVALIFAYVIAMLRE